MIKTNNQKIEFRISVKNERFNIPVGTSSRASLQFITKHNNSWTTAKIAVRCSLDNDFVIDFPSAIEVSGETRIVVDTSSINYLHLVVTTAEATTSDIIVNYSLSDYQS